MLFGKGMSPAEKEWAALYKSEARFLQKQTAVKESFMAGKLEKVVPRKLQETLNLAFYKAFQLVFENGTGIIDKTYNKGKREYTYKMNAYAATLKESRKNIKAFSKHANGSVRKNLVVSGLEGVGTGILGIGIPDIPVFTGVILKSIYEIAASYGYRYESDEEQEFILKLIKTSLEHGEALIKGDKEINDWIKNPVKDRRETSGLMRQAADKLSEELLYMKFIQGIPIVGVIGGLSDSVCLKKVTDYAGIKYKRRFLTEWKSN